MEESLGLGAREGERKRERATGHEVRDACVQYSWSTVRMGAQTGKEKTYDHDAR